MEREQKPDAVVRVNDFDVTLYRRGQGLLIRVQKDDVEVGFFGFAGVSPGTPVPHQSEQAHVPAVTSQQTEVPAPPAPPEKKTELNQPVKITGLVEAIEGMGQTPTTGDPVFRFSIKTEQEEIKQIAAFREIGKTLHKLTQSSDPNIKLIPGRPIGMMAWDHTTTTGSYYPSSVNYLNLPPIINPKRR